MATARKRQSALAGSILTEEEINQLTDELFFLTDVDDSGTIQFAEFANFHLNVATYAADAFGSAEVATGLEEIQTLFRSADTDFNQKLDKEEFISYMRGLLSVLGARTWKSVCTIAKDEETRRRITLAEGFDRKASEMLLEQAQAANFYKPEMQEAATRFLDNKADPNCRDKKGNHALLYAADRCEPTFILKLLEARADASMHNKEMDCAAFKAARARQLQILGILLLPNCEVTVDAEVASMEKLSQELVRRMSEKSGAEVKELLSKRADMNYKDDTGWTPLTSAVFWGKQDCVEALIKSQSALSGVRLRLDGRNARGRAALHVAARKGLVEIVTVLISARANPDVQDSDGWTPLHHAVFNGVDGTIQELIRLRADLLIQGCQGFTAWMVSKMPSRAGNLSPETIQMLQPPEGVCFAKRLLPVLKDAEKSPYERLEAIMGLPGVRNEPKNLRLHEQCFDPKTGPNKVRLLKIWEGLALPLLSRLRTGEVELAPLGEQVTEEARTERLLEIAARQRLQKAFVQQWLEDSKGPAPSSDWKFKNRGDYGSELHSVVETELEAFQKELDDIYTRILVQPGGEELSGLPPMEILDKSSLTQLCAHPIPLWLEQLDAAGAFEALRVVGAAGTGGDDEDSLLCFAELTTIGRDFHSGRSFWKNVYRLWLAAYAKIVNEGFHRKVRLIIDKFNEAHEKDGLSATYRQAAIKSYERIKQKEHQIGKPSEKTYEGRTVAAQILDIVRGSCIVNSPQAAYKLLQTFRQLNTAEHKLRLVRVRNGYSQEAESNFGFREIELNVLFKGGLQAGACGRPHSSLQVAMVGEVVVILGDFVNARKGAYLLHRVKRGDFDWDGSVHNESVEETDDVMAGLQSQSLHDDDDALFESPS